MKQTFGKTEHVGDDKQVHTSRVRNGYRATVHETHPSGAASKELAEAQAPSSGLARSRALLREWLKRIGL
jgi:hypothetical protein